MVHIWPINLSPWLSMEDFPLVLMGFWLDLTYFPIFFSASFVLKICYYFPQLLGLWFIDLSILFLFGFSIYNGTQLTLWNRSHFFSEGLHGVWVALSTTGDWKSSLILLDTFLPHLLNKMLQHKSNNGKKQSLNLLVAIQTWHLSSL